MKENYFVKDKLKKIAIENYLKKKLSSAGFIDVEVIKSVFNTRVVIYTLKPGFVIGKKGSNIRSLTEELEKKFDLSKVHIEIGEIPNKNLDPKVIMENISTNIGKGIAWKSVVYGALRQIKEAGAIGAEIIAKGNTSGKGQRKRKSRFAFGYMKKAGDQKSLVAIEKKTTFPGLGTIGITLRIVKPDIIFSDKIDVLELSRNYKLKIQEEDLLERQEVVKKDVSEKIQKKEKSDSKEKSALVNDEDNKKVVEKKVRVKKDSQTDKLEKSKLSAETKSDVKEKVKSVKKDAVIENNKDVDAPIKEKSVLPDDKIDDKKW